MQKKAVTLLILGIGLVCCGGEGTPHPAYVSETESGQTIGLAVGQELFVTLSSNASTGYSWSFYLTTDGIVAAVGTSEYLPDQPVIPGSGGRERFRFRAARTGRTTVEYEYRRPWETESPAAQIATYHLVVQ